MNESELEELNKALPETNPLPDLVKHLPGDIRVHKRGPNLDIYVVNLHIHLPGRGDGGEVDRVGFQEVVSCLRSLKQYGNRPDKEPARKYTAVLWHPEADGPEDNPVVWFEAQVTDLTLLEDLARTQAARNWNLDGDTDWYEPDQFQVLAVFRGHHQAIG